MAKALKIVGTVISVAAMAVGVAIAVVGTGGAIIPLLGVTLSTAASALSTAAAVVGLAAMFVKPPGFTQSGNPIDFQTNPQSGLPYGSGRTRMSGLRIHGDTTDGFSGKTQNDVLGFAVLLCAGGLIQGIDSFRADKAAIGSYSGFMSQVTSLGGSTALTLSLGTASMPGWSPAHKLSGMAHSLWMLRYDSKGVNFQAGVPEPEWIGRWTKCYDPRLDSTYPGGSGPHRALNESTYTWTRNPALQGLTWALGRWQNGKRTLGIGAPVANIRVSDFVEAANVADANNWTSGGFNYSTDSKWNVLKAMLQAGGAIPTQTGAMIGCLVSTPRVSITTISSVHLHDGLSLSVVKSRRDRFNKVIPRYRSEAHEWQPINGSAITNPTYLAEDGREISREIDLPMVQHELVDNVDGNRQAGQLATYAMVNSREAGPISFTTGPQFIGIKSGDVVTLNVPEEGISDQDILIKSTSFDPATGKISFIAETETFSKHAFALGKTTTPPPAFTLTPISTIPVAPSASIWSATASLSSDGIPSITVSGANEYTTGTDVIIQCRKTGAAQWQAPIVIADPRGTVSHVLPLLDGQTSYDVEVAYRNSTAQSVWRTIGPVTTYANGLASSIDDAGQTAVWDQTTGRPPLLTGDSVTADDTLLDPSVWQMTAISFASSAVGEGYIVSSAGQYGVIYHKVANATPVDHTATYEASWQFFEPGSGTGTANNYIVAVAYDAAGNHIAVDGSFWYYPSGGPVRQKNQWETQSARFGQGTDRPFPPNAVKFGLGVFLNLGNLSTGVVQARRFKAKRVSQVSFTAVSPQRWTLSDGAAMANIAGLGWSNVAYSRAAITGPQRFTARFGGPTDVFAMMGLTEAAVPSSYFSGAGQIYLGATPAHIYEGGVLAASYTSIPNARTAQYTIEYDGLRLRYFVNGVALAHSTYVGPNKSYRAFVDAYDAGYGLVGASHVSGQGAAIVGGNTYNTSGALLSAEQLLNSEQLWSQITGAGRPEDGATVGATPAQVSSINNAITLSNNAQVTADSKIDTFYQTMMPTTGTVGDLWFDTNDGNKQYRHNGTTFVIVQDQSIGIAITAAAGAQATADGKVTTYVALTAPTASAIGDLWFNSALLDLRRWTGTVWSASLVDLTAASQLAVQGVDDITINYDHAGGSITTLPKTQGYTVTRGGTDVTATSNMTVTVKSGTIAASIAGGILSLDKSGGVLTSSVLEIGGTYNGAMIPAKTVRITRENAAAPSNPPVAGSPTTDSSSFTYTTGSQTPAPAARELIVVIGSLGQARLYSSYEFDANITSGTSTVYAQWYKWNGSAYVAIGTADQSEAYVPSTYESGGGILNITDTGNTAGSTQKYRLYMYRGSRSCTNSISGGVSATGVNP